MHPVIAEFIPVVIFCIPALGLYSLFKYRDYLAHKSGRRNPLTRDLLRGPGETIREKLDGANNEILWNISLLFAMPLLIYSMYLSIQVYSKNPGIFMTAFYALLGSGLIIHLLIKMFRLMTLRRQYALGLDAEIATGQELNTLMRHGYWVFHDFPAEKFNIDHVVIGANGIFAVETKGRSKPTKENGDPEYRVIYDGEKLEFPWKIETKPLDQAARQAEWLQKWLTGKVGEPIEVLPVLALPGWFIEMKKWGKVGVINGKKCEKYFLRSGSKSPLPENILNRAVDAIEERCRNIRPLAYRVDD